MDKIGIRNTSRTKIHDYKISAINSIETAVGLLSNIRKGDNVFVKHIDLDDYLRNSEGSKSTVLDGNVSEKDLIEEIYKRNVDKITMFVRFFDETVLFRINLHTWVISVSLKINSKIILEDLENVINI